MPITISFDLRTAEGNGNHRSYLRSMFERFGWRRLSGTVLRYQVRALADGTIEEDWLNDVIPSLMFFRSYVRFVFLRSIR